MQTMFKGKGAGASITIGQRIRLSMAQVVKTIARDSSLVQTMWSNKRFDSGPHHSARWLRPITALRDFKLASVVQEMQ